MPAAAAAATVNAPPRPLSPGAAAFQPLLDLRWTPRGTTAALASVEAICAKHAVPAQPKPPRRSTADDPWDVTDQAVYADLQLEGHWTRTQLLAICQHVRDFPWSLECRKMRRLGWMADFVRLSEAEVLAGRYHIGKINIARFREDLARVGLHFGMRIGRVEPRAIGAYVLRRAGITPGDPQILLTRLQDLPLGMPLPRVVLRTLRWGRLWGESHPVETVADLRAHAAAVWHGDHAEGSRPITLRNNLALLLHLLGGAEQHDASAQANADTTASARQP